jgi:hypothetical protein
LRRRAPSAIGRSNAAPLRTSAGARFTVMQPETESEFRSLRTCRGFPRSCREG